MNMDTKCNNSLLDLTPTQQHAIDMIVHRQDGCRSRRSGGRASRDGDKVAKLSPGVFKPR